LDNRFSDEDGYHYNGRGVMPFSRFNMHGFYMPGSALMGNFPFLRPLRWLLALGLFLLFVWLLVKFIKAAWQGGGSKSDAKQKSAPAQATVKHVKADPIDVSEVNKPQ